MFAPPYLSKGDTIAIVSTARKITREEIADAINTFENWGLRVEIGNSIGLEDNQYAGTDKERAADFQKYLDDPNIKAIVCARGGYGSIRLTECLNFRQFTENPKWIVGYSDVTVWHTIVNHKLKVQTLHSTMPINFKNNTKEAIESLKQMLFGEALNYSLKPDNHNRNGNCTGELVGGNLSILYSMLGTKYGFNTSGKILFIEDLDEYLYHVDRMMMAMKLAGKLDGLAGLVAGGLTDMNDNTIPFGKTVKEIVLEHTSDFDYPICFDFPSGHIDNNLALKFGANYQLSANDGECLLKELVK